METAGDVVRPAGSLRWRSLAGAAGMMLCIGTAYSWSLFTRPLMVPFDWSSVQVSASFALMIFGIGIGAFTGGLLLDRFDARAVGVAGAALWGLGNILAGIGTEHFGLLWLYATYGLIGGFGGGMAYVIPGANASRWFPRHRGLVNGLVLLAFGMGSVIYNDVVAALPQFAAVLDAASRAVVARNASLRAGNSALLSAYQYVADKAVVMDVFAWSGIVFTVVGVSSAFALATPAADEAAPSAGDVRDYRYRDMLRTRAFYVIWGFVFVDCFAGLALLGNAVSIYAELTGAGATTATFVYGWLSIFNGLGRLLWAWISDSRGRVPSLVCAFVLEAAAILRLSFAHVPLVVGVAFAVLLLCFGGVLAIAPAMIADYFGTRYLGENYGCVITAVSLSGLTGPILFGVLEDVTGSLTGAIVPVAAVVAVAALLPLAARRPPDLVAEGRSSLA